MSNLHMMEGLKQATGELEAYEQPITAEQCHNTIKAVQDLAALLRQKESAAQLQAITDMRATVAYHYAIGRADEARLQLAAFVPICGRSGMQALRRRQIAAFRLREFVQAAAEALGQQKDISIPRSRPDYLRLVELDSMPTDVQKGVDS